MFRHATLVLLLMSPTILAFPGATAASPPPSGLVIFETARDATLVWTALPASHDVYGVRDGVMELLGTTPPEVNVFVAPPGYDSYLVQTTDGAGDVRTPCVRIVATLPPQVRIIPVCSRHAQRDLFSLP